jgi:hypothetical protein
MTGKTFFDIILKATRMGIIEVVTRKISRRRLLL